MMTLRRHKFLRSRIPLRRKTRLRPVSRKQARRLKEYALRRRLFLMAHPFCEIGPILQAHGIRVRCLGKSTNVHHAARRGIHLLDEDTWMAACDGECHNFVEIHPDIARKLRIILT